MMLPRTAVVGLALLAGVTSAARAAELYVDGSTGSNANDGLTWATAKASVTAAVDVARTTTEADTVYVAEGRYGELLSVPPDVTLLGGHLRGGGPRDVRAHATVLDGRRRGVVVTFESGADFSVLDGFVVTGGEGSLPDAFGGGVRGEDVSPTIRNCIVEGNRGPMPGIRLSNGLFRAARGWLVEDTIVRGNVSTYGAAMSLFASNPIDPPEAVIRRCVIEGNVTLTPEFPPPEPIVVAGLHVDARRVRIEHVLVRRNSPTGGLVRAGGSSPPVIVNSEFTQNATWGLVAACDSWPAIMEGCTFSHNGRGGIAQATLDLFDQYEGGFTLRRSILWGNGVPSVVIIDRARCAPGILEVDDSLVEGGIVGGTDIIDADPLFAAGPAGGYYLGQVAAGQATASPAVDAGNVPASDVGLDTWTTRTDAVGDQDAIDLGVHYRSIGPYFDAAESMTILRGVQPDALVPLQVVGALPFTDEPGLLDDPARPLLYYRVEWPLNPVRVRKDTTTVSLTLHF
jgi:hypothetical protein